MAYMNAQAIVLATAYVKANTAAPPNGYTTGSISHFSHAATGHYVFTFEDDIDPQQVQVDVSPQSGGTGAGFFAGWVWDDSTHLSVWTQAHGGADADADFNLSVTQVRVRGTGG